MYSKPLHFFIESKSFSRESPFPGSLLHNFDPSASSPTVFDVGHLTQSSDRPRAILTINWVPLDSILYVLFWGNLLKELWLWLWMEAGEAMATYELR